MDDSSEGAEAIDGTPAHAPTAVERVLVFDDDPKRHDVFAARLRRCEVVQALTAAAAREAIEGPRFDTMYLDHDMELLPVDGGRYDTGDLFCIYLVEHLPIEKRPALVVLHSWNDYGAKKQHQILTDAGFKEVRVARFRQPRGWWGP